MRRESLLRGVIVLLVVAALVVLPALGGCKKDPSSPETPVATGDADNGESQSDTPADGGATTPETQPETLPADDGSSPTPGADPPSTLIIRLAWVEDGAAAFATERTIPYTQAVATAAMEALLAGPTQQELQTWPALGTCIPSGTKLLGLTVSGGVAKVDLSKEFESGGGTFSVTARLAQVVYTLTQFPSVQSVEFYIEGQKVEMFSSEGLILDGPQTIEDYDDLLPMDA